MNWYIPDSEAVARAMDHDGVVPGRELPIKQTPPGPSGEPGAGVNRAVRWCPDDGLVPVVWRVNYVNYEDGSEPPFGVYLSQATSAEAERLLQEFYA